MRMRASLLVLAALAAASHAVAAPKGGPSRAPVKGCVWEKLTDRGLGVEAWVQRCDFGFRKIDFLVRKNSLAVRYSDGGEPEPLVDVFDLNPGEKEEAGIMRLFRARTPKTLADRCVLRAARETKAPRDVKRFTFVPNAAYQEELDAKADPNEVGDPPCGEWGIAPDGIQYFEVQPSSGVRKILFVRVGQDEPLFDEKSLRLLP